MSTLLEWTLHYIKSRDAAHNNIERLKEDGNTILVTHRSMITGSGFKKQTVPKEITYQVEDILQKTRCPVHTTIITYNTDANIRTLLDGFSFFAAQPDVRIIFVNPETHEIWQIMPSRHERLRSLTGSELKPSILGIAENTTRYEG